MFQLAINLRVHVGAPRPSKRTKLTSYLNRCFPLRARARFRSWRRRAGGRRAPPSGRGRFDRNSCFEVTQSRPRAGHREKPRCCRHTKKCRAELNSRIYENRARAYTHAPSTSVRLSPLSSNPRACHFVSRRVSCVAAKATVEVGLASPFSSPRAAVARRTPAVSLDGATSVGVVIFDSVVLVIVVCPPQTRST